MSRWLERRPGGSSLVQDAARSGGTSNLAPGKRTLTEQLRHGAVPVPVTQVQRSATDAQKRGDILDAATRGLKSPGGTLPHLDTIQRLFGPVHDLQAVQAHVGGAAASACDDMGANAYATGSHVAFPISTPRHMRQHTWSSRLQV